METTIKKNKSTLRKVISGFLGVLFIVFVVCGIVVATYVFSSPSKDGESRQLIMGNWIDHEQHVKFTFSEDGDFKMVDTESDKTLGKGYCKIDEDKREIKILLLHGDRSDEIDFGITAFYFCTLSYSDLKYPSNKEIELETKEMATATFQFQTNGDRVIYKCERDENKKNFYGKEISGKDV